MTVGNGASEMRADSHDSATVTNVKRSNLTADAMQDKEAGGVRGPATENRTGIQTEALHEDNRVVTDGGDKGGWNYDGIVSYRITFEPMAVETVLAIQRREVGAGDSLHRRVELADDNRVGPATGGSPGGQGLIADLDVGDPVPRFDVVGIVTTYNDGPLTETAGVVYGEVGYEVEQPRWYWTPIEHEAEESVRDYIVHDKAEGDR